MIRLADTLKCHFLRYEICLRLKEALLNFWVQVQILQNEKEKVLEESVRSLDEKLASALDECNAKDELVIKFTKMAEEAMAGDNCISLFIHVVLMILSKKKIPVSAKSFQLTFV